MTRTQSTSTPESLTESGSLDQATLRLLSIPAATLFTAILAQIAIPTAPLGIPISLQSLAVLLTAMALGPKLGSISMTLYLITGAIGVGVFAEGESGWLSIIGQTGGYLIGFVACQPFAHWIIRRKDKSIRGWLAIFVAGLVVHAIIFAIGVPWLWFIRNNDSASDPMSWSTALYYGMVVFIPGMLLKSGIAAGIGAWCLPSIAKRLW
ncbi:MAG: biotin transporter BioY [Phycisphaerales bacterium]|nr:biotin transporter BioY [Phycisphaerales bacterium]